MRSATEGSVSLAAWCTHWALIRTKVPDALADEQVLFLSDILPTRYQAAVNAQLGPGSSVAIFGAGPVGLMSALSARFLGADKIFMVDHRDYRLKFAQDTYGVILINFDDDEDPAQTILAATQNHGVDACIDAVGFEAKGSALETTLATLKLEGSSGEARTGGLKPWVGPVTDGPICCRHGRARR